MDRLNRGFTLIELMIVVAIIGLLAALAIPNFNKFMTRSRQSEAKSNLKALYSAEKCYYQDKQQYLDLLDVIGFAPEGNNRYQYNLGAPAGTEDRSTTPPTVTTAASTDCPSLNGIGVITFDTHKWNNGTPLFYVYNVPSGTVANLNSAVPAMAALGVAAPVVGKCCLDGQCEFAAGAVGNVDSDRTIDEWFISSQGGVAGGGAQACANSGAPTGNTGTWASGEPVNNCNDVSF